MSVTDLDARTMSDVIDVLTGKGTRVRTYANGRIRPDVARRTAYSYGTHFPLFEYVPRNGRHAALFVINGDRWNGPRTRTPDHQSATRRLIEASGIRSIVIPFSALEGAGMRVASIRPLDVRGDAQWEEVIERRTLAELPVWRRTYSDTVENVRDSLDRVPERYRRTWRADENGRHGYGDILPDADGKYRWTEPIKRTTLPDADGIYRWTETRHRLGDSLFTAERTTIERRAARPFESESTSAREDVILTGAVRRSCSAENDYRHEAGPSASCIHCNEPLDAIVTVRRRARYLSSFDYNEPTPLYFLCEVPRGSVPTVQGAIDSLAPRAVHSAILQGREVRRQGDVFFIDTALTRDELISAGAVFGRLTQWTRGAKPRRHEVTFRAPNPARDKAVAAREHRHAVKLWRQTFRDATARATAHELDTAHPCTPKGSRARWSKLRARRESEIASARTALRRATLVGASPRGYGAAQYGDNASVYRRRAVILRNVQDARGNLERALAPVQDSIGHTSARHARDNYRARYGQNAQNAWNRAKYDAQVKYRPDSVGGTARNIADREAVQAHLSIYGTAHSASEVARVGSAVYVRGTVSHAVSLETGRREGPDHRPIVLTADHWYLAVRNTVPRQNRRNRRRGSRSVTG